MTLTKSISFSHPNYCRRCKAYVGAHLNDALTEWRCNGCDALIAWHWRESRMTNVLSEAEFARENRAKK